MTISKGKPDHDGFKNELGAKNLCSFERLPYNFFEYYMTLLD